MMRTILGNEWTAAAVTLLILSLHCWWFFSSDQQGDVVSGLGGALAALGIWVATQPYIRKGLKETAREEVGLHHPDRRHEKAHTDEDRAEGEGIRHVIQERIVGVILIGIGSLLNGYGPAIAHLLLLRGAN